MARVRTRFSEASLSSLLCKQVGKEGIFGKKDGSSFHQMKKVAQLLTALTLTAMSFATFSDTSDAVARYRTCVQLRRTYPYGVALARTNVRSTRARVNATVYRANRHLDLNRNGVACERGERIAAPVTTSSTTTTTSPPIPGSSRQNPITFGATGIAADGWQIRVVSVEPNATSTVLAWSWLNSPPGPGGQYYMVRVRATYLGSGSSYFNADMRLRAMGPAGNSYWFDSSCGRIPSEFPAFYSVFTGQSIEGNVCWAVSSLEVPSLMMYDESFSPSFSIIHRYFALR